MEQEGNGKSDIFKMTRDQGTQKPPYCGENAAESRIITPALSAPS